MTERPDGSDEPQWHAARKSTGDAQGRSQPAGDVSPEEMSEARHILAAEAAYGLVRYLGDLSPTDGTGRDKRARVGELLDRYGLSPESLRYAGLPSTMESELFATVVRARDLSRLSRDELSRYARTSSARTGSSSVSG